MTLNRRRSSPQHRARTALARAALTGLCLACCGLVAAAAIGTAIGAGHPVVAAPLYDPHQNPPPQSRDIRDWMTPQDKKELREMPADNIVVLENPPVFGWRSSREIYSFEVVVERNGRPYREFRTTSNVFRPGEPLPPGRYAWRVRRLDQFGRPQAATGEAGPDAGWSVPREFEIRDNGIELSVPAVWDALDRTRARKRPRALPATTPGGRFDPGALTTEQRDLFNLVAARFQSDPAPTPIRAGARMGRSELRETLRRINDALAVRILHGSAAVRDRAASAALVLVDNLTAQDPFGDTGHEGDDLLNIRLAKAIARAFDVLKGQMTRETQLRVRRHVEFRTQAAFDYFILNDHGNLGQFALSSHGFQIVTHILAISALMAGDSDRATLWFRDTYPLVSMIVTPWGGGDGGYSNGINYGVWEFVNHVDSWDIIHNAIGFPYFDTAWVRNFTTFLAYFAPPGVSHAGFGDGGELLRPELWTEISRLYVERGRGRVAKPMLDLWYSYLADGTADQKLLTNALFWPRLFSHTVNQPDTAGTASDLPRAAVFPDIGWGAIHSGLGDTNRHSVFFKSSQFGSFSHSHADQNAFIVLDRGRPLLLDSGYYDRYRSDHHNNWTRTTRAHNAITYDGGKGQPIDDPAARGRLTDYWRCGPVVMMAGDAAQAYGDGVDTALRTLLYLPGGNLLVFDRMEADSPHTWEWNFHAAEPVSPVGATGATVRNGPATARIEMLAGPEVTLERSSGFTSPPQPRANETFPQQYHGVFTTRGRSKVFTALTRVAIGDATGRASARAGEDGSIAFTLGSYAGQFRDGRVTLTENGQLLDPTRCAVPPRQLIASTRLRFGRN